MSSREDERPLGAFNRVAGLLFVLGLCLANSILFYFVIWDMFSPSKPYTTILFVISGGANLVYVFLPWFARSMLAPIFQVHSDDVRRFDGAAASLSPRHDSPFASLCTIFGAALCVTTLGLWLVQAGFGAKKPENLALITKANCLEIGGEPQNVDGKLICIVPQGDIRAGHAVVLGHDPGRI